jgi:lactoylglutathione lyase
MAQTIAIERVDHIGIRVRDLDRALAFYRVLGFALAHRAVGDDVAIVRNEHGVELNLIFNADAGGPDSNILMDVPDKFPGYTHMALRVASIPRNARRFESERYRDHAGAGQLRRKRASLGLRARP